VSWLKMEHAKKLVLSVDGVSRFGTTPNLNQEHADSLQQQMSSLLGKKGISDELKLAHYNQMMYRYFAQREALNEPVKFSIYDEKEAELEKQQQQQHKSVSILASAVGYFQQHKLYRENAAALGRFLMERVDNVQWNNTGEIIVNGRLIHGSNLTKLMEDVLKLGVSTQPAGYRQFAAALTEANLPQNLVGETTGVYRTQAYKPQLSPFTSAATAAAAIAAAAYDKSPGSYPSYSTPSSSYGGDESFQGFDNDSIRQSTAAFRRRAGKAPGNYPTSPVSHRTRAFDGSSSPPPPLPRSIYSSTEQHQSGRGSLRWVPY
jgi:hypothetical protein